MPRIILSAAELLEAGSRRTNEVENELRNTKDQLANIGEVVSTLNTPTKFMDSAAVTDPTNLYALGILLDSIITGTQLGIYCANVLLCSTFPSLLQACSSLTSGYVALPAPLCQTWEANQAAMVLQSPD